MNLLDQLKRDEGVRLKPYTDTVGKLTIGAGFNLTDVGLYPEEVDFILANRIAKLRAELAPFQWYSALDSVRQGAIENMAYNVGLPSLLHFPHLIAELAKQDWVAAAREMRDSIWAKQVGDRAVRLEHQILSGEWT
jgi:lysozyme